MPAHVALGVVLLALGDKDAAIARWREAVQIDPGNKAAAMYLRMAEGMVDGSSVPPKAADEEE